jgi:hypothetical protein
MPFTPDSPIVTTTPQGKPEQAIRFMLARAHGEYTDFDISTAIVPTYFAVCAPVGVEPLLMLAQLVHETGNLTSWWSQRPRRNPAGIGVTGQKRPDQPTSGAWQHDEQAGVWKEGVAFASWKDDSVPAHVGRMLAYALRDDQATAAQLALIKRALSYRPLSRYRGEAPTLQGLRGRWAVPGTEYPGKLAQIANAMLNL